MIGPQPGESARLAAAAPQPPEFRRIPVPFGAQIPENEWHLYEPVIREAQRRGLPFALGGGFAYSVYSGMWRNTKDIDLYVRPDDHQVVVDILNDLGYDDYHTQKAYDRSWIYRSFKREVIVDVIWSMPNHRADVDARWLTHGQSIAARGITMRAIPVEELIFAKLYVMQRERCDWPDLLSILWAQVEHLDWPHLIDRVGEDLGLLAALMRVFAWLCPGGAAHVSDQVWAQLGLVVSTVGPECSTRNDRVRLLDSRPWFAPLELTQRQRGDGSRGV